MQRSKGVGVQVTVPRVGHDLHLGSVAMQVVKDELGATGTLGPHAAWFDVWVRLFQHLCTHNMGCDKRAQSAHCFKRDE